MALVSVIIPCYQHNQTLPRALQSLGLQTYSNWEAVIVDDGNAPPLAKVQTPGCRLLRVERNRGAGYARQKALEACRGELLAFLDADDRYLPEKLALQVEAFHQHPQISVVTIGSMVVDRHGDWLGRHASHGEPGPPRPRRFEGLRRPDFALASAMLRTDEAREVGFREQFRRSQDLDFYLRFLPGRYYLKLPQLGYLYTQEFTAERVRENLLHSARVYWGFRQTHPWRASRIALTQLLKRHLYWVLDRAGLWPWVLQRRYRPLSPQDQALQATYRSQEQE